MYGKLETVIATITLLLPYLTDKWSKDMKACIKLLKEVQEELKA